MGSASGLPPGRVLAIEADGDGTIWAGTDQGSVCYDGYQFRPPSIGANQPPLTEIRRIVRLSTGDIAMQAGESIWTGRGGTLRRLATPPGVAQIAPLGAGGIYISTRTGHFRLSEGRWLPVSIPPGVRRLEPGDDGRPWITVARVGVLRWDESRWSATPRLTGVDLLDVLAERSGVWVASARGTEKSSGMWEQDPAMQAPRRVTIGNSRIIALSADGTGLTTFDSGDVLARLDGKWRSLRNTFTGALLRRATSILLRDNGEIWAGTNGGINVYRAQPAPLKHKSFPPGDSRNNVHELVRRRNGELWVATSNGLVVQFPGGTWRTIDKLLGKSLGVVTGMAEDAAGNMWVSSGSSFGGAFRLSGERWLAFGRKEGLTDWHIHRIRLDRDGHPWFLTNAAGFKGKPEECGAYEWNGTDFRFLGEAAGMPTGRVTAMAPAPDGALWFAADIGLMRYADGKWENYREPLGITARVFDVAVGPDGAVWFCHQRALKGVGRLLRKSANTAEVRYFTESDGVPSQEVWAVYAESDGRIWASTANGVGVYHGGPGWRRAPDMASKGQRCGRFCWRHMTCGSAPSARDCSASAAGTA